MNKPSSQHHIKAFLRTNVIFVLCLLLAGLFAAKPVCAQRITTWAGLQAALDENNDGGTVKLTRDITAGANDGPLKIRGTVTLDLNSYTISRNLSQAASAAKVDGNVITVYGNLTIVDTSMRKPGKITGGNNKGNGGGVLVSAGKLTIKEERSAVIQQI